MDPHEMETLIQRLVANPHDEQALAYAHHAGAQDPRSYAALLEKVGALTVDPSYAAHWLSEAANVWSTTIGDAHHAARTLMSAIEKDPTHRVAAERLAQLYRDKGDQKALVALLEKLVKLLGAAAQDAPEVRAQLATLHEELGRLWSEPPLTRPERALENWRRLIELDPRNVYAIYAARELLKAQQQFVEAIGLFTMEHALVDDPERKTALFRDEADVRLRAGDGPGSTQVLRNASTYSPDDLGLRQEVALSIIGRIDAGELVAPAERSEAAQILVALAEQYDGEHGFSYSTTALLALPGDDRAMQLADYYGKQLGRTAELGPRYEAYLKANPNGFMAADARASVPERRATPLPPPPPRQASVPGVAQPAAPAAAREEAAVAAFDPGSEPAEPPPVDVERLLKEAQTESQKGRKPQALAKYREVLAADPASSDALAWVEEHLRQKRMYADLRDVLLAAARVSTSSVDTRKAQLRDAAGICESQLRDIENAVLAWKQVCQLDRGDEQARDQLRRLLEKGGRWDDLATLLEQDAMSVPDVEQKIALEKKLAQLHETKRKDLAAAAEAWSRIAGLSPDDESPIQTAVKLYEKADKLDLAAEAIAENISAITDGPARSGLLQKLGELRTKLGDLGGAGEVYAEAAQALGQPKAWELAEKAFVAAERYEDAANAVEQRAELADGKAQAGLFALAADLLVKAGDPAAAVAKLERAAELDPTSDTYSTALEEQYLAQARESDLITHLLARADKLGDKARRTAARSRAAGLQRQLGDTEGARESLLLLLSDGDDADALRLLVDDAAERGDHQECADLLRRLGALVREPAEKLALLLREAELVASGLDDIDGAIERYEAVLRTLDPRSRTALRAIADLEEGRDNAKAAAHALERELILTEGEDRTEIAQRLAQLYEGSLDEPAGAIRALEVVHAADPEDFDAIARLEKLCSRVEDWPRVATLTAMLIEVEGDDDEASVMARRLAELQEEKLGKGDEALATLERLADQGDEPCREAYVALGDKLGWKGIVATKLVTWNESTSGPARNEALQGAFERFVEIGRDEDACRTAMELARSRGASVELARQLEQIGVKLVNVEALSVAHDLLAKDLSGEERAAELVRQAEVLGSIGVDPLEAMQHGESALTSVGPAEAEALLARLASLTQAPGHVIDLYERQIGRCRAPVDRLAALARAAQVAAERGAHDRARSFFELALGGGVQEDTIAALEAAAQAGDALGGGTALRLILAEALAAGGQGSRDGGRTRSALLRRAATIAQRDLGDLERAFGWLGDAIVTHVDEASLEALVALGHAADGMKRVEATLGRALEEVFDGPLVRKLLATRAKLRREVLGDAKGASVDLKKLHDLSPSDHDVMAELSSLLLELGDHRGMIQLYEDQILRGREPAVRAELARKVARIWEEDLGDARESADAWRRVLRMKAGDPEATAGLERAKIGKLKRPPPPPVVPGRSAPPPGVAQSEAPMAMTPAATRPGPDDAESTAEHVFESAAAAPLPTTPIAFAIVDEPTNTLDALPHDGFVDGGPTIQQAAYVPTEDTFTETMPAEAHAAIARSDAPVPPAAVTDPYVMPPPLADAPSAYDAAEWAPVEAAHLPPAMPPSYPTYPTDGYVAPSAPTELAAEDDIEDVDDGDLLNEETGQR
jgi:tetratricopeptide (TPR) repeat protein